MLAVVVVLLGAAAVVGVRVDAARTACAEAAAAPGGRWCSVYEEDFDRPAALGSFVSSRVGDWHLQPGHPYADSLRSYPDGWGTTADWSLNYASRTADVVPTVMGASGVFRLHGHSADVDGRTQALGGSFYAVLDPAAGDESSQMAQTYGRYTVRFATRSGGQPTARTEVPGYGTAFLLWPANDRWAEGEVDFPELVWGAPLSGSVHTIGRPEVNADTFTVDATTEQRWTTATLEWTPGLLVFALDGVEVRRVTHDVPSTPFRWGFQSGGTLGTPAPDLSGYLYIDSVRIDRWASAWGQW